MDPRSLELKSRKYKTPINVQKRLMPSNFTFDFEKINPTITTAAISDKIPPLLPDKMMALKSMMADSAKRVSLNVDIFILFHTNQRHTGVVRIK
jgi:hypothetical protein